MVRADDGAVDHLQGVGDGPALVQRLKDVFPQTREWKLFSVRRRIENARERRNFSESRLADQAIGPIRVHQIKLRTLSHNFHLALWLTSFQKLALCCAIAWRQLR